MRLCYSQALDSNYLVVEAGPDRSVSRIAYVAHLHRADRKGPRSDRFAIAFRTDDGDHTEPAFLTRAQLKRRGCIA